MCSTAVLCRGPAMLLPRGCRGHATGKRKGGLEGRRGAERECIIQQINIIPDLCIASCFNPLFEPNVRIYIQHRFGLPCSHFGNPTSTWQIVFPCGKSNIDLENHVQFWENQTSIWKAMYPFWEPNIDLNILVPIWTPNIDSDVKVPM